MSKNNKGFAPILIILAIIIAGIAGYFGYKSYKSGNFTQNQIQGGTLVSTQSPTPTVKPKVVTQPVKTNSSTYSQTAAPRPTSQTTQTQTWVSTASTPQPTPTPTPKTPQAPTQVSSPYSDNYVSLDGTNASVTFSRSNANQAKLVITGGITLTSKGITAWSLQGNPVITSGQGFYLASGGITVGSSVNIQLYINADNGNGTYSGSVTLHYTDTNGVDHTGPTLSYTETLTN